MNKVVKIVMKKVVNGRYDVDIFDQLTILKEVIKGSDTSTTDSLETLQEFCPFIKKDYSMSELKELRQLLLKAILEELKKEDISYLQTARLIEAFDCLDDAEKLPKSNKKIKFLITFNRISQGYYMDIAPGLKQISLLDE